MNTFITAYRGYIFLSFAFVLGIGAVFFLSRRTDPKPIQLTTPFPRATATLHPSATPAGLVVEVSGAVVNPGLFHLADGARVDDAIRAAGGAGATADLAGLNLARRLSDGELLLVPAFGDATQSPAAPVGGRTTAGGRTAAATRVPRPTPTATAALIVNINTAGAAELIRLPGIGPSHAQRIIDYREANGPFQKIEDITRVKGIGPAEFNALKNRIVVQ